jgi:RsiW-degrading membrane proteinase PrsW (M82 family)
MDETTTKIILAIFAVLPAIIWWKFYLSRDPHPEPKLLLFLTFLGGVAMIFLGRFIFGLYCEFFSGESGQCEINFLGMSFFGVFFFAASEELLKFVPVWLIDLKRKALDEPVDLVMYMVSSALGFAAMENINYVINGSDGIISGAITINLVRSFTAILLHSLSSGIFGYVLAIAVLKGRNWRKWWFLGLLASGLLHAVYNYFIISIADIVLTLILLLFSSFFLLEAIEYLKNLNVNYIIKK